MVLDLFKIRGEEQEGGERGGADGVPLGEGLGGVAGGVELVGAVADGLGLVGHLDDAAGVVGDGAEGIHGEDVGGAAEHAHGGDGGAVDALGVVGKRKTCRCDGMLEALDAEVVAEEQRGTEMTMTGMAGVSMPTARPLMMLVAGPVSEAFTMDWTGR